MVLLSWCLVGLWSNAIEKFAYKYLLLDEESALHSAAVASVATLLFMVLMYLSGNDGMALAAAISGSNALTPLQPPQGHVADQVFEMLPTASSLPPALPLRKASSPVEKTLPLRRRPRLQRSKSR